MIGLKLLFFFDINQIITVTNTLRNDIILSQYLYISANQWLRKIKKRVAGLNDNLDRLIN